MTRRRLWPWFVFAPAAVAVVFALVTVRTYRVPSGSMMPTLMPGAHLVTTRIGAAGPVRGRVVVFDFPDDPTQQFAKRIVAVPGDTLSIVAGKAVVNGKPLPACEVGVYEHDLEDGTQVKGKLYVETLDAGPHLVLYADGALGAEANLGPFTVAPGEVWVLGDNRWNSHDSPMWGGGTGRGVPLSMIRGRSLREEKLEAPTPELAAGLAKCLGR